MRESSAGTFKELISEGKTDLLNSKILEIKRNGEYYLASLIQNQELLFYALSLNNSPAFSAMITAFNDKKIHDMLLNSEQQGSGLLHIASFYNCVEAVDYIISKNPNLEKKDFFGRTALHFACQKGHLDIVENLVKARANVDEVFEDFGGNPLFIACKNGHEKIVDSLLKYKYQINEIKEIDKAQEKDGATLLITACQNGHNQVVDVLLKWRADFNKTLKNGATPMFIACENGFTKIVEALIRAGAEFDQELANGATPLFIATHYNQVEAVEALIKAGAEINKMLKINNATSLHIACRKGNLELARALVGGGANVNATLIRGDTPLYIASENGYLEMVKFLLASKVKIDEPLKIFDFTPLHVACEKGHAEIVKALVAQGADINNKIKNRKTPLDFAIAKKDENLLIAMLDGYKEFKNKQGENGEEILIKLFKEKKFFCDLFKQPNSDFAVKILALFSEDKKEKLLYEIKVEESIEPRKLVSDEVSQVGKKRDFSNITAGIKANSATRISIANLLANDDSSVVQSR